MTRRDVHLAGRVGRLAVAALAATAVLGTSGCLPGLVDSSKDKRQEHEKTEDTGRKMRFELAADNTEPVAVNIPTKPVASAKTSTDGMVFELYALERSDKVVNVVFAMHNTSDKEVEASTANEHLDETPAALGYQASNVSVLDPEGLKEYRSFLTGDEDDQQCLCSEVYDIGDPNDFSPGERQYYMTQVAAPPKNVTEVTVLANVASLPNQTIEG